MAELLPFVQKTATGITTGTSPVETSEAPTSHLSGAEVAEPFQEFASAMNKGSEALDKIAEPLAERAGAKAVTRDADGNIQIDRQPFFGAAGYAYARAVKVGALADGEGQAKRDDIAMREQYRDNPEGYQQAANAYREKMRQQYTDAGGVELGNSMARAIDGVTTQTYKGLLNEKEKLDLQKADQRISAGVTSARDDAMALARQGISSDAPEMQALLSKYATLQNERMSNPRLAYTKEQADLDSQEFQSQLGAQRYLYHTDQTYQKDGYQAAMNDAKDIQTNTDYKLSPQERDSFYHKAVGEIRANEAIRRQDVGEARASFNELTMASATGARIDPDQVEQTASAFRAAGDPGGAARVYASFARKPLNDDFGRQPLTDQTTQLNALKGAAAAQQAVKFFQSKGYSNNEAAGIVGNLMHESGVNPFASGDSGTSAGIAQFHNERLAALRNYAASVGKPATDFQTQLEFVDKELNSTESATRDKMRGAQSPEAAAAAFINYERPKGWTPENPSGGLGYQNRQSLARTVFNGQTTDGSGGVAQSAWLTANRQMTMDKELWSGWQAAMKDYNEKGIRPNDDALTSIVDGARATGNSALMEQISHDMARIDLAQDQARAPLGQQHAALTNLGAAAERGDLSIGQAAVYKDLQTRYAAVTKGLEDNPIQTAVTNFPDKFKTPGPLNLQDPQQLVAGLKMRAQIAQTAAQNWQSGPLSALDKQDVAQFKAALNNPDPAVKAGIYGALATLPEDVRGATLSKLAGGEPAAMTEAAAGSMMSSAPDIAASIFRGQSAMKTDKAYVPEKDSEGTKFTEQLNTVLPVTAFSFSGGARTDPAGPYAVAQNMIKARYADLSAQSGDTSGKLNDDRLKQSVDDVTGGILHHNGGDFIAPQRGMPQTQFDRIMAGITDNDMAGVTSLNGQPVTADYLRGSSQLESIGAGRYLVRLGKDPMKPIYAYQGGDQFPQKFVLDLHDRVVPPSQPMTGLQAATAGNAGGNNF